MEDGDCMEERSDANEDQINYEQKHTEVFCHVSLSLRCGCRSFMSRWLCHDQKHADAGCWCIDAACPGRDHVAAFRELAPMIRVDQGCGGGVDFGFA